MAMRKDRRRSRRQTDTLRLQSLKATRFVLAVRIIRNRGAPTHPEEAIMSSAKEAKRIRLERHSPFYWRVTFDHPPLNIFGPESIPQLNDVVTALETDSDVKVVVFD